MKYSIRRSVFETNSSSVHVIAIGNKKWKEPTPNLVEFSLGEFGWGNEFLKTVHSRAAYLYTGIVDYFLKGYCGLSWKQIEKLEKEGKLDSIRKEKFDKAIKFVTDTLSEHGVRCEFEDYENADFYVDHFDDLKEFLGEVLTSKQSLMFYLFSPDSVVELGCDQDDHIPDVGDYGPEYKFVCYKGN